MFRIIVAGTRDFNNFEMLNEILEGYIDKMNKDSITIVSNSNNTISLRLFDEDDQNINVGRACFKVNYLTMQTNITVADGIISFNYKSPKLKNSDEIIQKLTIKYDGTVNYNNYEKEVDLIIK